MVNLDPIPAAPDAPRRANLAVQPDAHSADNPDDAPDLLEPAPDNNDQTRPRVRLWDETPAAATPAIAEPDQHASNPRHDLRDAHLLRWRNRMQAVLPRLRACEPSRTCGRLTRAAGLVLEAVGLRLPVGSGCLIELPVHDPQRDPATAEAEVVGFAGERLFLMPQTEAAGLLPGARVFPLEAEAGAPAAPATGGKRLPVGDALLGRVVDGAGRPLDDLGPLGHADSASLSTTPINPLSRAPIDTPLDVGVRAINALLTVGRGQRMGLFAGSGVGKSVLLGMMARYTSADVIVVGLIGERGREVKDFIENILGAEGLARAVVVAAPADVSPLVRMQGAAYATTLAEHFRDQGKDVLLIMDSLTRYAMAQREIALAIGEPPATKGYPPSVFAKLPALVERAGNGAQGGGSITAFYTVLTEGDDQQDPIADAARAILDGHIVLSRDLAEAGHYPAIDIEASISRAMVALVDDRQFDDVRRFKQMLSRYQRNRDLISVGAYAAGRDPQLDQAIALYPQLEAFLQQGMRERAGYQDSATQLHALLS
ncbi:flagellum-specific ATP synthase FliI [Pandoraea thiooxydans]|uniref:flagellar protein export ATPase FliI n=1 Tax=Pandoraea thiooxydans TaxID=445709 RepID=UPI00094A4AD4|nr:flagellar protein export ATPase FliI [Pandoraea thiooxydans]APR97465.1 flagellum-specific ATP synthase FliI [Pandoraea thiooxydans]